MKWLCLTAGLIFLALGWLILQIGKGVTFTYGGYEEWDDVFLSN